MHAIIVDDELKGRNLLRTLLEKDPSGISIVGIAAGAREGIELIRQHHPDVVFLDIHMPEMNGFEMLQELRPASFDTVFVTAYDQFAIKAFRYHAFDYLLKPIDADELTRCTNRLQEKKTQADFQRRLESLLHQLEQPGHLPDRITIHSMDGITVIPIASILYLEAAGAYTIFYCADQDKIISSINLKEYEDLLSEQGFFRVHHSYLVNMGHVKKFLKEDGGCILITGGSRIQLSKRKREEFLRLLENK
ncbi:MAG TPA: response regulator [Chitinophagaceae bacterium]|nr:response regulator [Chitinophagaceae bacterium]